MNIQEIKLVGPLERIRTTDQIPVCIEVKIQKGDEVVTRLGIGTTTKTDQESLREARDEAIRDAVTGLELVPAGLLRACVKVAGKAAISKAKGENNMDYVKELESPCNDTHQKVLDRLCIELGISTVSLENYNIAEFYCMRATLNEILDNGS